MTERASILLVEDEELNREIASRSLAALGYRAVTADNGEKAVRVFSSGAFALILLDWHLPGIDGFETLRRLREKEAAQGSGRVPIVGMTAGDPREVTRRGAAAGFDDMLPKPFHLQELEALLRRWIERDVRDGAGDSRPTPYSASPRADVHLDAQAVQQALVKIRALQPDNSELVAKLVNLFLTGGARHVVELRSAVDGKDLDRARLAVHSLKSSSRNMGAVRLATLCQELEGLPPDSSADAAAQLSAQIEVEFARISRILEPHR